MNVSQRYVFAVLCSMGLAITYGLKVNFHVCIVAMVNHTALADSGEEGGGGGGSCGGKSAGNSSESATSHLIDVSVCGWLDDRFCLGFHGSFEFLTF